MFAEKWQSLVCEGRVRLLNGVVVVAVALAIGDRTWSFFFFYKYIYIYVFDYYRLEEEHGRQTLTSARVFQALDFCNYLTHLIFYYVHPQKFVKYSCYSPHLTCSSSSPHLPFHIPQIILFLNMNIIRST